MSVKHEYAWIHICASYCQHYQESVKLKLNMQTLEIE